MNNSVALTVLRFHLWFHQRIAFFFSNPWFPVDKFVSSQRVKKGTIVNVIYVSPHSKLALEAERRKLTPLVTTCIWGLEMSSLLYFLLQRERN